MGKRKRGDQSKFAVDESMDWFINAEHLPAANVRYKCRRKVIAVHYGNDRLREFVAYQTLSHV